MVLGQSGEILLRHQWKQDPDMSTNLLIEDIVLGETDLSVRSYQIEDNFFCHVENKDPGAVISRAKGSTREEARAKALEKARYRLS